MGKEQQLLSQLQVRPCLTLFRFVPVFGQGLFTLEAILD